MLAPQVEAPFADAFFEVALKGRDGHAALAESLYNEVGLDVEYRKTGILRVARTEAERVDLQRMLRWQTERGLHAEWIESQHLGECEPLLAGVAGRLLAGGLWLEDEAQVRGPRLVQALATAAMQHGAQFLEATPVTALQRDGSRATDVPTPSGRGTDARAPTGRVTDAPTPAGRGTDVRSPTGRVTDAPTPTGRGTDARSPTGQVTDARTPAGRVTGVCTPTGLVTAETVVLAAGVWTPPLYEVPVKPVKGQILSLRALGKSPRQVLWCGECYLVPRPDGEIVLGATEEEGNYDLSPTVGGLNRLTEAALEVVPAVGSFNVEGFWAGLRPAAPDRFPIVGWSPDVEGLFLATAHYRNGILLGPLTGKRVADCILEGKSLEELSPFGPERFQSANNEATMRSAAWPSP